MNRTTLLIVRRRIRIKRRASACGATAVEEASRLRACAPRLARRPADLARASGATRQPRQDIRQWYRARREEPKPRKPAPARRCSRRVLLRDRRASRDLPASIGILRYSLRAPSPEKRCTVDPRAGVLRGAQRAALASNRTASYQVLRTGATPARPATRCVGRSFWDEPPIHIRRSWCSIS
jgi:hypothetical protein